MDVIVAGAGPAGASIARLLAMSGKRVVLVDPGVRITDRLEILPPAGYEALGAVGLAEVLDDPCIARPCLGVRRRWGSRVPDTDDFLARRGGRGFTIDRAAFDHALRTAAARAGVAFIRGRMVGVGRAGGMLWARIATACATLTTFAAIAVDATGRRSAVARRMGAHRQVHERLIAERRSVEPSLDAGGTPVWLDVEGAGAAWSYQMLGPRGRRETWDVYPPGARRRGPANPRVDASSVCLSRAAGHDWIAIGDAATSFDPVTSQGLVHALATSRIAAGAILSPRGLDDEACRIYSHATAATFAASERGRAAVYDVLRTRAMHPRVHARHHG
jgi:flavin-dependent dehydrogenase